MDGGRQLLASQRSHIKITRCTSPKNKAFLPKTLHLVEKSESFDEKRTLIELTNTTFQNRTLVNLAIVFTCLLLIEVDTYPLGFKVPSDTESVSTMRFG